jgi:hypothetical protein
LAKGSWGETPSKLIGCLFIVAFAQAAEERASIAEAKRRDFYLYVDEMQNFQNEGFDSILAEARKMRLSLTLANQFYAQLPDSLQTAISGNVANWISFRVGAKDAQFIADELDHHTPATLKSASNFQAWVKTLQNGAPSEPIPIVTFPPHPKNLKRLQAIRARTRACHTRTLR